MMMRMGILLVLSGFGLLAQVLPNQQQFETIDRLIAFLPRGSTMEQAAKEERNTIWTTGGQTHAAATYTLLRHLRAYRQTAEFGDGAAQFDVELEKLERHFRALLLRREEQVRAADRDNLARYAAANRTLASPKPGASRVVFFGDSITQGWRLAESFPSERFPQFEIVNRGISGQITGEMLGRMKADVLDLQPRAMILLAGTNDLARGVAVETIQNNIAMMADLAKANNIRMILCSILPVHDYNKADDPRWEMTKRRPMPAIRQVNAWMKQFAAERGLVYVDYFAAMLDQNGYLEKRLAGDGLHPNQAGYDIMNRLALAGIEKALATPAKR